MEQIKDLIKSYYKWLEEKTDIQEIEGENTILIGTPFENFMGDYIDIYVRTKGNSIEIFDNGETLESLEFIGIDIKKSKKRRETIEYILATYGLKIKDSNIYIETDIKNFPRAKHRILQGILQINDMYLLTKQKVASVFKEDVREFLEDELNLPIVEDIEIVGKSGLPHHIDFIYSYKKREVLIKASNSLNQMLLKSYLYTWRDIKDIREKKKIVKNLIIINDENKEVKEEFLEAIKKENSHYLLWSERNNKEVLNQTLFN